MKDIAEKLLAHRGYCGRYPENTLIGIKAAVEAGANIVEFDVQLTKDLVPVVVHDANLKRVSGTDINVLDSDFSALKKVSVHEPQRFGDQFGASSAGDVNDAIEYVDGTHILTLVELIDYLKDYPDVTIFVEPKRESVGVYKASVMLDQMLRVLAPIIDRVVLISFALDCVHELKRRKDNGEIERFGWVMRYWEDASRKIAEALEPDVLSINQKKLPNESNELWSGAWQWYAYGANDIETAIRLDELGVDIIGTDCIGELLEGLKTASQKSA